MVCAGRPKPHNPDLLSRLTTSVDVVNISNMRATELARSRIVYSENAFAELVLWRLPQPMAGSKHSYKYRLAFVVSGECVVRYDNEAGKGDHRHYGGKEMPFAFSSVDQLLTDFQKDIARWQRENSDA